MAFIDSFLDAWRSKTAILTNVAGPTKPGRQKALESNSPKTMTYRRRAEVPHAGGTRPVKVTQLQNHNVSETEYSRLPFYLDDLYTIVMGVG